ncbi:hypothetical protein [Variovorax sp. RA8]|uniref:hypothetical protein n=1 Tax=Variovorax sp. (strain JCM 16519 / RA8) TaxID=662548 RepID=UPI0013A52E50|nr:hypothetical protein [Variovorax sp. RA8]
MRFIHKRITPARHNYTPLVNNELTDTGAWKARLVKQLPPHDASPFNQRIRDYLIEDDKSDLSSLVCECMKHGNVDVLTYILANEDIKSLHIEGPISGRGWKALAKAIPDALHATELTVSKDGFDAYKCKQLFRVLKHMPELQKISLSKVTEEGGILFDQLECPDLPELVDLDVFAKSDPKAGGFRLPLKILRACKVQRLSIEESGAISIDKHLQLAKLLPEQTLLDSLRLKIEHRDTPKQFECYMPFLCGETPTPLVHLDLSSCCIGAYNLNQLLEALPQTQSALASLSLSRCGVARHKKHGETIGINLLPLAGMNSLAHLDLSDNLLPPEPTVALLAELQKTPNRLEILNLNRNLISKNTYSAMASFLRDNETLRRLSFEPSLSQANLHDEVGVLNELVGAMEQNKCLLELEFHWSWPIDEHRASVDAYLDRNRKQAFMDAASQTAAAFVMPRLLMGPEDQEEFLNRRQLPKEFVRHIIGQGLSEQDALTLSSLNKATREAHEEFLRKAGS